MTDTPSSSAGADSVTGDDRPPTCATCRFWRIEGGRPNDIASAVADELAVRDPVTHELIEPQPFEVRPCRAPLVRFYERPARNGAAIVDGSEYFAALVTGPDFGCIAHEGTSVAPP